MVVIYTQVDRTKAERNLSFTCAYFFCRSLYLYTYIWYIFKFYFERLYVLW